MKRVVLQSSLGVVFALSLLLTPIGGRVRAQEAVCTPDMVLPSDLDQEGYAEVTIMPEQGAAEASQCATAPVADVSVLVHAQTGGEAWMDANKSETAPSATVGSSVAWRIIITNNGTQPLVKLSVLLTSPLHVTNVVFDPELGSVSDWTWMIPELQAGESLALQISALAVASGETDISARVHAVASESNTENNQDVAVVVVSGSNQTGVLGESITVNPEGQSNAQGAVLAAATGLAPTSRTSLYWLAAGSVLIGAAVGFSRRASRASRS